MSITRQELELNLDGINIYTIKPFYQRYMSIHNNPALRGPLN